MSFVLNRQRLARLFRAANTVGESADASDSQLCYDEFVDVLVRCTIDWKIEGMVEVETPEHAAHKLAMLFTRMESSHGMMVIQRASGSSSAPSFNVGQIGGLGDFAIDSEPELPTYLHASVRSLTSPEKVMRRHGSPPWRRKGSGVNARSMKNPHGNNKERDMRRLQAEVAMLVAEESSL